MAIGNRQPYTEEKKLNQRFCWNCYNFEDRRDMDGVALCAKGHTLGTVCDYFVQGENRSTEIRLGGHFCWNCCNFEDRRDVDGIILCAKGQHPEGNCDEFVDRNGKLREITNNNRHERVLVKAIVMENTNPANRVSACKTCY